MIVLVSFLSGIMASMGLGGGLVLILYLTIFANKTQLFAQGVNLIFFIPIAIISLIMHSKKGLVKWKISILPIIFGSIFVCICSFIAHNINSDLLTKAFAVLVIITGLLQLFQKPKN